MPLSMNDHVPCLTTALNGPLQLLEKNILTHQTLIESWFRSQWQKTPALFYSSVDLRNAGFKLAPVDTNLFPAGFNNLNPDFYPLCIQAVQATLEYSYPGCARILLIPESHSRNMYYFESLASLYEILMKAGYDTRIGSLQSDLQSDTNIQLPSGRKLTISPLKRNNNRLGVANFDACLVLLNNDLSEGVPEILKTIEQPIMPSVSLGWSTRLKSTHFQHYEVICKEFAELIHIDPWLISPLFSKCDEVDFMSGAGEEKLVAQVERVRQMITEKYNEYTIDKPPFVVIKAESGTYGMGVMMVFNSEEIRKLNRKERSRMSVSKGGKKVHRVIIQEGVYTFETVGEEHSAAEPVVYMIGQRVVGGFYRVHTARSETENLNTPGMHFEPLAFDCACNIPDLIANSDCRVNRFYAYGVIARLAALAAAREAKALLHDY